LLRCPFGISMVTSNSTSLVSRTVSARWRWVAVGIVLVVAAAAGAAYVATSRHTQRSAATAVSSAPPRPAVLAALPTAAPMPADAAVTGALAVDLRDPAFGGHVSGQVVDATSGAVLWDRKSGVGLPPASTVKILTAVAALSVLGPDATLTTDVVRSQNTLFLVGHGDVTLRDRARPVYPASADLATLAHETVAALGATTTTPLRLCVDTTSWAGPARAPGWSASYFNDGDVAPLSPLEVDEGVVTPGKSARVSDPAEQVAGVFGRDLAAAGVKVSATRCRAAAPPSGLGLASVSSPPVSALVQRMLTVSDNDLAESLGRAIATRSGGNADFAGEALAITDALARYGVTTGITLYDASGLSRLDRVSPQALVKVIRLALSSSRPEMRPVLDGLPVAGLTGTLADRYRRGPSTAAAGLARAKTGTLLGVNTLAGYVVDADGRLLVFAFMTDRAVSPDTAEPALDRLAAALAGL
jgi:D-alanyl-D-alanine carboxypeptidase/D-alanyl-D-alanine-endopeptidase (penicillin-binding protein 4)